MAKQPTQVTSIGVSIITEHNAANARQLVEDLVTDMVIEARGTWLDTRDEVNGFVVGFLLNHPAIHNALVPKESR